MNSQQSRQQIKNNQIKVWKQGLIIDKRSQQSAQKDLSKLFSFSLSIPQSSEMVSKILKEVQTKNNLSQKQQKKIFTRLNQLNGNISQLKQTLKYYQHTNQYLVKVQNLSQNVYNKIQKIKDSMSNQFQQLLGLQESIQNDLKLYDNKIQMILQGDYQGNAINRKQQQNQIDLNNKQNRRIQSANNADKKQAKTKYQNLPPKPRQQQQKTKQAYLNQQLQNTIQRLKFTESEVDQIENKINGLGKNLGWNEDDHNDFIKIWNRCQGRNYFEIEEEMGGYLKLYTDEQIRDHMNKYMKLRQYNEEKKEKIIEYKQLKQGKKVKQFQILALRQLQRQAIDNKQKNIKKSEEQQHMMKQKVEEWKKIKQEKRMKQSQKKQSIQQQRYFEKIRKMQQNMLKKQVVQKWKEEQQEIKTKRLRQSRDTKHTLQTIDKQTQERIRQREQKLVAQKMQKVMRKKYQEEQKLLKQQKLKQQKFVKFSYVNSKLQEKTTAIKEKQRQKFDGKNKKDANTFGGNLLHAGIRATPAWMQGL